MSDCGLKLIVSCLKFMVDLQRPRRSSPELSKLCRTDQTYGAHLGKAVCLCPTLCRDSKIFRGARYSALPCILLHARLSTYACRFETEKNVIGQFGR